MTDYRTLDDVDVKAKRVLVRLDLNVPMKDGEVSDTSRIDRAMPTVKELIAKGAKVVLLSHFDRPKGKVVPSMSLKAIQPAVEKSLGAKVAFANDCIGPEAERVVAELKPGQVALLENTRFHKGEEDNDPALAREMAKLGDIFVNDAFSAAHRAHASTEGLAHLLPAVAGRAMQAELDALTRALEKPERPVVAIVGGAKISTKLELLDNLTKKVDAIVIGGGMANTFLAAKGLNLGKSLCEHDLAETARKIMDHAQSRGCDIVLPVDAVIATEFKAHAAERIVGVDQVPADAMILDLGPLSVRHVADRLAAAKTVVWNGPLGAFELKPFDAGTVAVALEVARLTRAHGLVSVAGGGDTLAALNEANAADDFTYVSTAGGAFLEWLEGKELPGVTPLKK